MWTTKKPPLSRNSVRKFFFAFGTAVHLVFCPSWLGAISDKNLTPSERVRFNAQKAQASPSLRGRWDEEALGPASSAAYVADNLAIRILSDFNKDEELSKVPLLLRVRSFNGVVTLEGIVNSIGEKGLIERKVRSMDGVKKVENHLRVKTSNQDFFESSRGLV